MAYNRGRKERKWRIWKESGERILRRCGVDEDTIEKIRIYDRVEFDAARRFYRYLNDVVEYLEGMADRKSKRRLVRWLIYWTRLKMKICTSH